MQKLPLVKNRWQQMVGEYLPNTSRRFEFAFTILLYFFSTYLMYITPAPYQGVIAALQSFVAFFLAFRFRMLGLFIALLFTGNELRIITRSYLQTHSPEFIVAIAVKVFTIIAVVLIGIVATRQEQHKKRLHHLAITDELTGLYNQRHFHDILRQCFETPNPGVGLIMLDIDNFKMFNDLYGHESGDEILKSTGTLLNSFSQSKISAYRCGGDEFAIILLHTEPETIEATAQALQSMLKKERQRYYPKEFWDKVTLSMGLSHYPQVAASREELLSQADMALYHAKNQGKDKIHFYQDVVKAMRKEVQWDHQQMIGAFKALLSTISAKDKYTLGHSERVSAYACLIGEALGFPPQDISTLQYAGLLHDIGKIEIPKAVLNKRESLNEEDIIMVHAHPVYSQNILEPLEGMDQLLDFVRHHHERFDGGGYPDGIIGEEISLGARILSVADSYDAMLSDRPYSKSISKEQAIKELQRCAGTQFDPGVVNAFIRVLGEQDKANAPSP